MTTTNQTNTSSLEVSAQTANEDLSIFKILIIVVCCTVVPLMLVVFGKLIERKYGYIKKAKANSHQHPLFDPTTIKDNLPPIPL